MVVVVEAPLPGIHGLHLDGDSVGFVLYLPVVEVEHLAGGCRKGVPVAVVAVAGRCIVDDYAPVDYGAVGRLDDVSLALDGHRELHVPVLPGEEVVGVQVDPVGDEHYRGRPARLREAHPAAPGGDIEEFRLVVILEAPHDVAHDGEHVLGAVLDLEAPGGHVGSPALAAQVHELADSVYGLHEGLPAVVPAEHVDGELRALHGRVLALGGLADQHLHYLGGSHYSSPMTSPLPPMPLKYPSR